MRTWARRLMGCLSTHLHGRGKQGDRITYYMNQVQIEEGSHELLGGQRVAQRVLGVEICVLPEFRYQSTTSTPRSFGHLGLSVPFVLVPIL